MKPIDYNTMRSLISQNFTLDELTGLCDSLGVNIDDLPGKGVLNKAYEMLPFMEERSRIEDLFNALRKLKAEIFSEYYLDATAFNLLKAPGAELPQQVTLVPPTKVQGTLQSVEIFCCYARKDQELLHVLKTHLIPLQRQGRITLWADTNISAGAEWENELKKHLNTAQMILLLVSPDFMASDYCYSKEMLRAMQRHEAGETRVVPILLRPVDDWQSAPFGKLQVLPTNAKPIMGRSWRRDLDEAFRNVAEGIRKAVEQMTTTL